MTGTLVVRAEGEVHVDGSKVVLAFETRGLASKHRSEELSSIAAGFDLVDGEERAIPFAIELPLEPVTLQGRVVGVCWLLRAELDVPWALDPTAEIELMVHAAPRLGEAVAEVPAPSPASRVGSGVAPPRDPSPIRFAPYVLLALVTVFVVLQVQRGELDRPAPLGSLQLLLVAPFVAYLAWRLGGRSLLNHYAARALGEPQGRLSVETLARGEKVGVTLILTPPASIEIERATATLICTETAHAGAGRDRRTQEEVVEVDTAILTDATTVTAGAPRRFESTLRVPQGTVPSFEVPNSYIRWEVLVVVTPRRGVDHVTRLPLRVLA